MVDDVTEMVTKSVAGDINRIASRVDDLIVLEVMEMIAFPTPPVKFAVVDNAVVMDMLVIEMRRTSTVPRVSIKFC